MMLSFLLKGILIGFSIAAPVGPTGVLAVFEKDKSKGANDKDGSIDR